MIKDAKVRVGSTPSVDGGGKSEFIKQGEAMSKSDADKLRELEEKKRKEAEGK